ncbi:hypothetical protein HK101_002438, partial [Irineochytrium annulatum]
MHSQRELILESAELRDGVLHLSASALRNLKLDLASGIRTQYDSLEAQFRTFLRYAASMGQYFDVPQIFDIFDFAPRPQDVDSWVAKYDSFAFLLVAEANSGDIEHRGYYFRHISILNCIYEGISFTDRKMIHLRIAHYLEQETMKNGRNVVDDEFVLPLVAYHFCRTGEFEEIVKYCDALGVVYYKKVMAQECIQTMEFLLASVNARQSEIANLTRTEVPGIMPGSLTIVRWKQLLADTYKLNGEFGKVLPLLREALAMLGIDWPDSPRECRRECRRQLLYQLVLWHRSASATKDIAKSAPSDQDKEGLVFATLFSFMVTLTTDHDSLLVPMQKERRTLASLLLINRAIMRAKSKPVMLAICCGTLGFMVIQVSARLSRLYLNRYARLRSSLPPELIPYLQHSDYMAGTVEYLLGDVSSAQAHMKASASATGKANSQLLYVIAGSTLPVGFMFSRGGTVGEELEGILDDLDGFPEFEKSRDDAMAEVWTDRAAVHAER